MDAANRESMRRAIAQSMRRVCERGGARSASIAAVAREAGITRELFYYYFGSRDEALDAMVDDYVDECLDCMRLWVDERHEGDDRYPSLIAELRRILYRNTGERRAMGRVLVELDRAGEAELRIIRGTIDLLMPAGLCAPGSELPPEARRSVLAVALAGVSFALLLNPEASDAELARALGAMVGHGV